MTTEAFGVLGYMMALMKMTNYKLVREAKKC